MLGHETTVADALTDPRRPVPRRIGIPGSIKALQAPPRDADKARQFSATSAISAVKAVAVAPR
jgi:hypothetical protein